MHGVPTDQGEISSPRRRARSVRDAQVKQTRNCCAASSSSAARS
jgi:hypothetical protein